MRILLGFLLCVTLLQAQIHGQTLNNGNGPNYDRNNGGSISIIGTYAGVLTEVSSVDSISSDIAGSVAIFSLAIPQTGFGTGTTVVFSAGRVFRGTINGVGDANGANGAEFKGIIESSFNYTLNTFVTDTDADGNVTTTVVTTSVTSTANGLVETKITNLKVGNTFRTLIAGTASVQVSNGVVLDDGTLVIADEVQYDVSGYRQSTSATGTAAAAG